MVVVVVVLVVVVVVVAVVTEVVIVRPIFHLLLDRNKGVTISNITVAMVVVVIVVVVVVVLSILLQIPRLHQRLLLGSLAGECQASKQERNNYLVVVALGVTAY